jgi:hypothetical protein
MGVDMLAAAAPALAGGQLWVNFGQMTYNAPHTLNAHLAQRFVEASANCRV